MLRVLEVPGLNSGQGQDVPNEYFVFVLISSRQMPGKFLRPEPLLSTSSALRYSTYYLMACSPTCCERS